MREAYILGSILLVVALALAGLFLPEALSALLLVLVFSAIALVAIRRSGAEEKNFLTALFVIGLLLRLIFGFFIEVFDLRNFFGADALGYHLKGGMIVDY